MNEDNFGYVRWTCLASISASVAILAIIWFYFSYYYNLTRILCSAAFVENENDKQVCNLESIPPILVSNLNGETLHPVIIHTNEVS